MWTYQHQEEEEEERKRITRRRWGCQSLKKVGTVMKPRSPTSLTLSLLSKPDPTLQLGHPETLFFSSFLSLCVLGGGGQWGGTAAGRKRGGQAHLGTGEGEGKDLGEEGEADDGPAVRVWHVQLVEALLDVRDAHLQGAHHWLQPPRVLSARCPTPGPSSCQPLGLVLDVIFP